MYGTDRARVDYSVLRFAEGGGRLILTHNRYSSPTCKVFVSGSSFFGGCVLAAVDLCFRGEVFRCGDRR